MRAQSAAASAAGWLVSVGTGRARPVGVISRRDITRRELLSTTHAIPRLQLLAAAALFSTGGAAIKATSLSGWEVASFRSGIAAVTVLLLVRASRRVPDWRVLAVGATYAATMILFVLANKLTTSANSIFLQSTAPLYILLLSPWLLREKIRLQDLVFIGVVAVGLLPFAIGTDAASATAPDPARGNIVALLSGVAWAGTLMGMRWLASGSAADGSAVSTVVVGNAIAFLVCLPLALPASSTGALDWAVVVYLGVVQIGLAYLCLTAGVRHVPALEASMLLLMEPALNPIWAWAVHGEQPSIWALAGGATILLATAARTWWNSREADPVPAPLAALEPNPHEV
ncbi:MAG: EamA family transporter [Gemmatimonadetes bacterium]|nr:EamA family transporter [Gemmatimonadota bacterium]